MRKLKAGHKNLAHHIERDEDAKAYIRGSLIVAAFMAVIVGLSALVGMLL